MMNTKQFGVLVAAWLLGGLLHGAVAQPAAPEKSVSAPVMLHIDAQPMPKALAAFAAQTGMQLIFSSVEVKKSLQAPALEGAYTLEGALGKLLANTELSYEYINERTLAIRSAKSDEAVAGRKLSSVQAEGAGDIRLAQAGTDSDAGSSTSGQGSEEKSNAPGSSKNSEETKLEEVVVTAQKRTERLQDVPVPVTAINTQALVEQNQLRLQDYYSSVPGLSFTTGGTSRTAPNLAIRGLTTGGNYTNPTVGIVVDDVPYGSSAGIGGGASMPDFDPGDLARVEVLRGPQGTLYGASSLGGLLKFVTVDPSTEGFSGRVQAGMSSVYNGAELGYNARGVVNVPIGDTFAVRASGFARRDPGYIDNVQSGEDGVNRTDVAGGLLSALWRPSEALSLKLNALYQDIKAHGFSKVDPYLGLGDLQQSVLRGIGGSHKQLGVYTAILKAKLGDVDLTSVSGYSVNTFSYSSDWGHLGLGAFLSGLAQNGFPALGIPGFGVSGVAQIEDNKTDKFSQELRLSGSIGQHLDWLLGGFYNHEDTAWMQDESAIDPATGARVGSLVNFTFPTTVAEYAGFADLTYHFTDRFNVQFGGRESQIRQTYTETDSGPSVLLFDGAPSPFVQPTVHAKDSSFTYLVTPQLKISPNLMVYTRLASGYRVGGPNFLCAAFNIPCHFKPDTTTNYELGAKGNVFDHSLSFDASLYYIDWKDVQLNTAIPNGPAYLANGGAAKSEGVELSVETRPLTGLTLAAWATWNHAVLTQSLPPAAGVYGVSGDRLPFSSRFSGHFSVQQDFPFTSTLNGFVGASVSYVGDRLDGFTSTAQRYDVPGYAQVDMRAGVRRDSWRVNVFVTNIADKRGLLSGSLFPPSYLTGFSYIQPRTVGLSVSTTF